MSEIIIKKERRLRRVERIRNKLLGQENKFRVSVFASNKYMYAQIIDDTNGKTVVSVNQKELKSAAGTKTETASELGKLLAEKAKAGKFVNNLVFDKGRYKYHGRVKAFADGAREGGLQF